MASLKLPISMETFKSERSNLHTNPLQFPAHCSVFSILTFNRARAMSSSGSRFNLSRVSPGGSELRHVANETRSEVKKGINGRRKWVNPKLGSRLDSKRNNGKLEKDHLFVSEGESDANHSVIQSAELSLKECNSVLERLANESNDGETVRFFEWMRKNGKLAGNVAAYNMILRFFGRRMDWESAALAIKNCGDLADYRHFNTLIYACSKQVNAEMSSKWFRMMLELGIRPNIATFGMVMLVYQKTGNATEAEFAFNKMRSFGIVCEAAYSFMITIYTRLKLYDKAEEVIRLMKEDNVVLTLDNWLVVINAYTQAGKLVQAEEKFVSMQEAGFPPNIAAINTLIAGYGRVSNMAAAQRLFRSITDLGLQPNEFTYRTMIGGWGRMGNYKEAKWHYGELKRLGFKLTSSNFVNLIRLQATYGDEPGTIETLNDMLEMKWQHSSIVSIVMTAYKSAGRIDKIPLLSVNQTSCSQKQSFIDLQASFYQHILVTQTSCSLVVTAYAKNGLVEDAIKVLREKQWDNPIVTDNLYHLLICSCKERGQLEDAVKIYTQMPKSDDMPNLDISCTMISIYTAMGRFSEGEELYLKLKSCGIALDLNALSIVAKMYIKAGSSEAACAVLETVDMRKTKFLSFS